MLDLLKLAGILALIVILLRLRWNLGLVLLIASAATGLLYGRAVGDLALDALSAAVDPLTLRLLAIVLLIALLGEVLRSTLQLEGLIRSAGDLFVDRRWLLALFPTLIGLLPMVGGAMFSAPMVEEASRGLNLSPARKTFVNYWFRHAWESIFPLYPSLVLAAGLMGATAQTLALTQWPLFLATVTGGILLGLVGIAPAQQSEDSRPGRRASVALLVRSIWPIVLLLSLSILLDVDLIVSLVITLAILIVVHRFRPRRLWDLARAVPLDIVPIIVGTMVFQQILESSGTVESVSSALTSLGIPTYLVVFAVPFIAGLMTGLAVAAFAIGFPIVLPLCEPDIIASGCGLLAYAGGFTGLLLSPVHLCLTLTRTYFQAEWGHVYRFLLPGALLIAAAAAITMWLK